MIEKLLEWSIRRRELVALGALFILIAGALLLRTMATSMPAETQVFSRTETVPLVL